MQGICVYSCRKLTQHKRHWEYRGGCILGTGKTLLEAVVGGDAPFRQRRLSIQKSPDRNGRGLRRLAELIAYSRLASRRLGDILPG